ncbi:PilT/PilU family type 4a pilus ATPase [Candidatus Venteria ishoeyi]|uniref:Twitching mobility protein n=1 Tax=Candidatus Venteria ishoeyi TaxID=1899563 RepID=A0A1H6FBR7_9GAMM|nr:PilT/PilU family type 4a pilus ATPase [Candidatus Venteria ishoeyi]MDM8546391.1 PilT/PilU family type 4a pilus ATPase [Candidatus Venteria ishoeyi]SEH07530.1 Twitching mobility protein [Candidatus Venteria ishoeyi]
MERDQATKLIRDLLMLMIKKDGSDLFITAGFPPAMKVKGKMVPVMKQALSSEDSKGLTQCIMNDKQLKEFEETKECNFAVAPPGIGRFRCNAFVQQGCQGLIARAINSEVPNLDKLNLPGILKDIMLYKNGLVIMVGGTGSGKSTSMAAMVDHRNANSYGHIITLEDPIEYVHPHKNCVIMQREIGVDSFSWEEAMHNTLRQAPDVILLGEIRSQETMEFALELAQTGHLAMATLHANNANQALDRVVSFFPVEKQKKLFADLSLNLRSIISQRLIKTRDGGRAAAIEILLNSPLIQELIINQDVGGIKPIMAKSREIGMQTFDQALFDLYEEGRIDLDTALANADSANELRLKIKLESKESKGRDPLADLEHLQFEEEEDDNAIR